MNYSLNPDREDLTLLQTTIEKFCENEIAPHYEEWEENGIFKRFME